MGRSIVITGAGSGLGRALARRLAGEGDTQFLMGRSREKLERAARELPDARAIACDVTEPRSVAAAFAEVAEQRQRLDVLINNAGVFEPSRIDQASDAHIRSLLDTNLAGPVYCSRAALAMMGEGSHIINIGSETVVVPVAMLGLYQSAKAGLERFSKTLDQEAAPLGIRVTLVRAGKMFEPGMELTFAPELHQQFVEENLKIGAQPSSKALSHYASVAATIAALLDLPGDVNVPEIMLEGRDA
jgi:NAD(P)-dependent dehydrogenase (short-subunit alcohol dehydrogenase family)